MTDSARATNADVANRAAAAFRPSEVIRIGAELEWLVYRTSDSRQAVPASETAAVATGRLPAGGSITVEPGGQLELATLPASGPAALLEAIDSDARVLVERFAAHDLALVPIGLDPIRPARRTLEVARYEAMERHFAAVSPAGLEMMNRTASLQLNIDFGPDPAATWRRAHALAPLLSAAFANSPTTDGAAFAPVSHRQQIWTATDPSRTRPVGATPDSWHRYILDAHVIPRSDTGPAAGAPPRPRSFAAWLDSAAPPTTHDLDTHITTLFPPLRPRGYLELRMLDALPRTGRAAAIATVWALLADPDAGVAVDQHATDPTDVWRVATTLGLADSTTRAAGAQLLRIAAAHLGPTQPQLGDACDLWREHVEAGTTATSIAELLSTTETP